MTAFKAIATSASCRLRWGEVRPDRLTLTDSKTRPRHVLLVAPARALLDGLAPSASGDWVFPGRGGDEPLDRNDLWTFWTRARDAAGIVEDARLHDLRYAHASHAVMNGESLHVAGRLLGHRRASTTNRYVHLDDATLGQAAERVAAAIERKMSNAGGAQRQAPGRRLPLRRRNLRNRDGRIAATTFFFHAMGVTIGGGLWQLFPQNGSLGRARCARRRLRFGNAKRNTSGPARTIVGRDRSCWKCREGC